MTGEDKERDSVWQQHADDIAQNIRPKVDALIAEIRQRYPVPLQRTLADVTAAYLLGQLDTLFHHRHPELPVNDPGNLRMMIHAAHTLVFLTQGALFGPSTGFSPNSDGIAPGYLPIRMHEMGGCLLAAFLDYLQTHADKNPRAGIAEIDRAISVLDLGKSEIVKRFNLSGAASTDRFAYEITKEDARFRVTISQASDTLGATSPKESRVFNTHKEAMEALAGGVLDSLVPSLLSWIAENKGGNMTLPSGTVVREIRPSGEDEEDQDSHEPKPSRVH